MFLRKMSNTSNSLSFASMLLLFQLISAQDFDYPTANLSTIWINSNSTLRSVEFSDGSNVRPILVRRGRFDTLFTSYACGFYCSGSCETYLFAIFIVQTNSGSLITSPAIGFPQVVWSANRNFPVKSNATLEFSPKGDLVLRDVDGTLVWSTNTSQNSIGGLNLRETGNLVLVDVNNTVVWQSFDHPTDALVLNQKLISGQKLVSSTSDSNWTRGMYSLSVTDEGLFAFIESNPPQAYQGFIFEGKTRKEASYVKYQNNSLDLFILSAEPSDPDEQLKIPRAGSVQYMRLGPDGHLNVYGYGETGWQVVADLLTGYLGECNYPMICGRNGICSKGQCSCPESRVDPTDYFRQINPRLPNLGCAAITPLTCNASGYHSFVELKDTTYFTSNSDISNTDIDQCKEACLRNCSCKAVFFQYGSNSSDGSCYLPSDLFSLMDNEEEKTHLNATALVKVQISPSVAAPSLSPSATPIPPRRQSNLPAILGSTSGGFLLFVIIIVIIVFLMKKKENIGEDEDDYLDHVTGMTTRFSYEELKIATKNFSKKLGEGGFGTVFEGVLKDNTRIAVKCLEGIGTLKKSFLAEVESIGSIHHVNLVRLIGFSVEKSRKLLVYEHMSNGSLDRWIYNRSEVILDWGCRKNIIQDVAKGLAYLHEECRQKIIHLDIKPQNILLDENYNAKLSDFGLSKLIGRDQSQVFTTMRGTPGYLAPEWLNAVVTEKLDVYSFGIVMLEILCGRKNFELSEPEECRHLLNLFKKKAEDRRLFDLIDKRSEDMQSHRLEVTKIMQVAAWCLQNDYTERPSMSVVVKVLEGVMDVKNNLDYSSLNSHILIHKTTQNIYADATPLLPSVISGPR